MRLQDVLNYILLKAQKQNMHYLQYYVGWISQLGCPSETVSDNGAQFVNKLIEEFTQAAVHQLTHRNPVERPSTFLGPDHKALNFFRPGDIQPDVQMPPSRYT